jgi:heme exporter protein A
MLTVTQIACSRGERTLFRDVSFSLSPGQWLQVHGENGVGKTTLLRTVVGLSAADTGSVRWNGQPILEARDEHLAATAFLGHQAALNDDLTPLENLRASLAIQGVNADEPALLAALRQLGLKGREHLPMRFLSAGQKRRAALARLLVRRATLWVLDEPFTALDAAGTQQSTGLIAEHLQAGGMALLTSHQPVALPDGQGLSL